MTNTQVARWCFTINNYTDVDIARLAALGEHDRTKYLVFGREVGESGTPHLQGFILFKRTCRFTVAKTFIGNNAHLEAARGSNQQAADYCKKDGDYEEFGDLPVQQGKRNDWEKFREFVTNLGRTPTRTELILHNPGLYARYSKRMGEIAEAFLDPVNFTGDERPRFGWQTRVSGLVSREVSSPRSIYFVVDPAGNSGKSWMCRYALSNYPDKVQVMRIGKRDDLAHCIDETKRVFMFDIPRGQMEYLQYSVLESLKDQVIFSPKYDSCMKTLRTRPDVIVFCNEHPDMNALTPDRYEIITI